MSDRFYTTIDIGGGLPARRLPAFLKALEEDGVYIEVAGSQECTITEAVLRQGLEPGQPLHLIGYEVSWGQLDTIETFCQAHELTYQKQVEPRYEWSGLEVNWQPGWEKPTEVDTNGEGSPIVPLEYLKQRLKGGWTLERIIEAVEQDRITVPPFEIVA